LTHNAQSQKGAACGDEPHEKGKEPTSGKLTPGAEPHREAVGGDESEKKEKEPSWKKQLLVAAGIALIGAVIGRAVGFIPDPFRNDSTEPSGSITIGETLQQTRASFLGEETMQPNEQYGLTLAVQRSSEHTQPGSCRIVWSYINPKVPTVVSDKSLVNQTARDVDGDAKACQGGARIWIPVKPTLDAYEYVRVRVELYSGDKQLGVPKETKDIGVG